jgi:hypothetical protein
MPVDQSTARIRSFFGLRASPAIWMAESKPISEKTTASGRARKIPLIPPKSPDCLGRNPPPAVKLPGCSANRRTMTVRTGTPTFHHTTTVLLSENSFTPTMLTSAKTSASATAITKPQGMVRSALASTSQVMPFSPDR